MTGETIEGGFSIDDALSVHTLSERYFFGYTTSRNLLSQLDEVIIQPYSSASDEHIYFRNHNIRAFVNGTTKRVEVPSALLANQLEKVHRRIDQSNQYDIDVANHVDTSDQSIYQKTDQMMGSDIDSFFNDLDPEGHVVLCRPEELLVELVRDNLDGATDFLDEYIAGSSHYLERVDDGDAEWRDVHESYCGTHPKFRDVDQMVAIIQEQSPIDVQAATAKHGVLRGYRLDFDDLTLTLLCRGWGRDMVYAMMSRLLSFTTPESVLFMGGCGAIHPELDLNDFVVPDTVEAPGEPKIHLDNAYLDDEWVRESIAGTFVRGTAYNVESPTDETIDYMVGLRKAGKRCVSMENYGVAKALKSTDIPFGILLFVMDCPLRGVDLGSTNYDPNKRGDLTFHGNAIASKLTMGWHGLLEKSLLDHS